MRNMTGLEFQSLSSASTGKQLALPYLKTRDGGGRLMGKLSQRGSELGNMIHRGWDEAWV